MRFPGKASVAGLSFTLISGTAWAADVCARAPELVALQVAAVQQQLMVAALTCDDVSLYNSFVITYQKDLLASDETLQAFFNRFGDAEGSSAYHGFKTKMANLYSARSASDKRLFCDSTRSSFAPALKTEKLNLASFALSQPSPVNEPYTNCGSTIAGGSMIMRTPAPPPSNLLTAQNAAAAAKGVAPVAQTPAAPAATAALQAAPPAAAGSAAAAAAGAVGANTPPPNRQAADSTINQERSATRPPPSRYPQRSASQAYRERLAQQREARQRAAQQRQRYREPYQTRGYFWPADPYWVNCYTRYGGRMPCAEAAQRFSSDRYYYRAPYDPWSNPPGR